MGMIDNLMANLYKPAKQEKPAASAARLPASAKPLSPSSQTSVSQGQYLRGQVLDLRANQILVLLENGAAVSARTEGTLNLSIGENARFFVAQTTEDQILLKLAKEETGGENPMIDKALNAAGITRTGRSVSIVTELLAHQQPVNEAGIRHFLSLSARHPELPVKDLILMELHQIPINKETVSQFADYHDGNGKLLTQATQLLNELTSQLEQITDPAQKQQLLSELAGITAGAENTGTAQMPEQTQPDTQTASLPTDNAAGMPGAEGTPVSSAATDTAAQEASLQGTAQGGNEASAPASASAAQANPAAYADGAQSPENSTPAAAQAQSGAAAQTAALPADTQPPSAPSLIRDFLNSFLLSPEEIADPERVKEYYEELNQKIENLEQFALKLSESTKEAAAQSPKQMRENLSFMDSVNQVFPFLQLPLKFRETPAHGELYVYERKRALKPSDSFSALLHLDLEALGTLDVFITLTGTNVATRFSLSDKDSGELIRSELPTLTRALAKKGYSLQAEVSLREPETEENAPTLLEQFLEEHAPGGLERYTFDIRA